MQNYILTFLLFLAPSFFYAQNEVQYPYNPDVDYSGNITVTDMLQVLGVYDQAFTPEGIMVDGQALVDWILYQDSLRACPIEFVDTMFASINYNPPLEFLAYRLPGALAVGFSNNITTGLNSFASGQGNTASGDFSFASGNNNQASGYFSHAEGNGNVASGSYAAHAEGEGTTASGMYSHAEGRGTTANYTTSHAEGTFTFAHGTAGHAEGGWTASNAEFGHTQNYRTWTYQYAQATSAAGYHTRADQPHQFVVGRSNQQGIEGSLFVVGNGGFENEQYQVAVADRSDAFRVYENGNAWVSDTLVAAAVRIGEMDLAGYLTDLSDAIQALENSFISDCTDPAACNYNPQASSGNDVCTYGSAWYADADGDGLGNSEVMIEACTQPAGYVVESGDNCDNFAALNYDDPANTDCSFAECNPVQFNGHTYEVVAIGYQCWFAENLQTLEFANGDSIPTVIGNTGVQHGIGNWPSLADGPGVSSYSMSMENFEYFGGLYNWYALDDDRGICPAGWHVPTDLEWIEMEMHLGMPEEHAFNAGSYRGNGFSINQKLRSPLFSNGSNESGFTALPGGYIESGYQNDLGTHANFWTTTSMGASAWIRGVGTYGDGRVVRSLFAKHSGLSVRCLQD